MSDTKQFKPMQRITESAIMIALATVLSIIPFVKLPYGGSVTLFSMVPIIIIAYRHGPVWGLFTGFVYSLIQLLLGTATLSYATSAGAAIAIILLDYVVAFTALGLGGMFRKTVKFPATAATLGALVVCCLRFLCHVISGCTVWAGVSIPSSDGLIYSIGYNATYMIPETVITVAGIYWLFNLLDFRPNELSRMVRKEKSAQATAFSAVALLSIFAAIVYDAINIFVSLQDPETGSMDITLISNANFTAIAIVTVVGIALAVVFGLLSKKSADKKDS